MVNNLFSQAVITSKTGQHEVLYKFIIKITISENERKSKQSRHISFKEPLLLKYIFSQRLVAAIIVTVFLLLIGKKTRNSSCDWLSQLSDNRCPITAFCYWTLSDK